VQARYELAAIYDKTVEQARPRRSHDAADTPPPQAVQEVAVAVTARAPCRRCALARRPRIRRRRLEEAAPTIKDLDNQQVDVSPDPPKNVDAAKTMESYKRFLDLNAGDAALREEALRRLGDLNLESSESERIERELATNEGLRATEAIHLYSGAAQDLSEIRAQRLGALPAGAGLRTQRAARQGAGLARSAGGAAIRTATTSTRRSSGAASCCSRQGLPARRRRPTRPSSRSVHRRRSTTRASTSTAGRCSSRARTSAAWIPSPGVLDSVLVSKRRSEGLVEIDTLSRPNRELVEDTFRVMSITFSYLDGPKTIDEFVKHRKPRPYYYLLYARLGDLYMEKERYTDAADSYRAFVSQDRNNEKAPLLEMQAIEAYSKGGFPHLVLQGKKEFVENYSYGTAYWQGRTPKDEPKVVAVLKINLKDVAQYYHAQAQRTKNVADYQEAAKWYRSYLTSFPDDPDSAVTNFCWPTRCSRASNISTPRRSTRTPPITTARTTRRRPRAMRRWSPTARKRTLSGEAKAKMHSREQSTAR
jgi:tetratricopeptide (TPR) repeat protein